MPTPTFDRDLLRGSIDLMVLSVLAEGPTYGYEIQKRLLAASADQLDLKAGTLYPILHKLEADKLVSPSWDTTTGRRRRFYKLTKSGHAKLKSRADQWHQYAATMHNLLGPLAQPKPA